MDDIALATKTSYLTFLARVKSRAKVLLKIVID